MLACALNVQYVQPVFGSSAYTIPESLAMYSRPPAMAGCDRAWVTFGTPKAHLSFSLGTSEGLRRAWSCCWKRVLATFTPHPFQRGPVAGSVTEGVVRQAPDSVCANAGAALITARRISACFMRVTVNHQDTKTQRGTRLLRSPLCLAVLVIKTRVWFRSIFQEWLFCQRPKGARSPDSCPHL